MDRPLPEKPDIKMGSYRHYKGGFYTVYDFILNAESDQWWIVYRSVEDPDKVFCRSVENFFEEVEGFGSRFQRIGG